MKRVLSLIVAVMMAVTAMAAYAETYETPGVTTGDLAAQGMFYSDYSSLDEQMAAGNEVHLKMVEEGQTLLKNENGALPLTGDERHITLLGIASKDFVRGGGGSGSTTGTIYKMNWEEAFEGEGFVLNPKTIDLYQNLFTVMGGKNETNDSGKLLEPDMSYYGKSVVNTFKSYNDAAVVFFSRFGRENMDMEMDSVPGHANENDHYLQLDDNEHELIKLAKQYFNKVIVVINSSYTMQIPELNAPKDTEYGVDAILWVGGIGDQGTKAAVEILTGKVNPSGHTVDIWPADFTKDPSFTNFSDMSQNKDENGERMNSWFVYPDGSMTVFSSAEFREGIYMGYRYYETVAADLNAANPGSGDAWYAENVTYPFGYGLSYTTFDWKLADINAEKSIADSKEIIRVSVEVENTGAVAGKDVVEIYYTAPYYQGGIEKAAAVLGGFGKTKLLKPGEKDIVTVEFVAQDMASFDSEDMNGNGFCGWEMEHGDYVISARRNSNEVVLEETFTVAEDMLCETDYVSGNVVTPVFVDDFTTVRDSLLENMISRADGLTQPKAQTAEERVLADWEAAVLDAQETYRPYNDEEGQYWYVSEVPADWTQNAETDVTPAQLAGKVYTEPAIVDGVATAADDEVSKMWDSYMNSLSWEELVQLCLGNGASEGPVQIRGGTCWQSAPITAATWNKELVQEQGRQYANFALLKGVYAINGTATNIHRSPFNGRNFEYYSEDPLMTGTCAALVVKECIQKGVINYAKHFFANVQEHNRADYGGVCTFATEQTFREIYVKSFEMMVKAGSMGLMTSFNRVGYVVNSNNWAVHEQMLRDQWGFKGATVTDAWAKDFVSVDLMVRAGDDILLGSSDASFPKNALTRGEWDASARDGKGAILVPTEDGDGMVESPTHYYAVRKSAQRHLQTLVNSNQYKNFASDYELSAVVYYGTNNAANISCDATSDFSVTLSEGQELPAGLEAKGFVVTYECPVLGQYKEGDPQYSTARGADNNIYGEYAPQGTYEVLVDMTSDGFINVKNVKLTIKVVSPFQANGELLSGSSDANPVIEMKNNEPAEIVIDSIPFTYQAFITKGEITNWYVKEGAKYLRDEEKTHADGTTIPYADVEEKHEVSYTLEGDLPEGLSCETVFDTAYGLRTNKPFEIVKGLKLSGTPTSEGEYNITVKANIPYCRAMSGIWLVPDGELTVEQTFTIVVK